MFGIHDLGLFIISGLLLNILPGPDTLYILSRSATAGWRGGVMAAFGVCSGAFVHILAATLGLSAILATSATAFTLVKWVGALYLVYMGIQAWRQHQQRTAQSTAQPPQPATMRAIFLQGLLSNALNPKVALFFLAFMPQFIDTSAGHSSLAFLLLGLIFDANSLIWCLLLATLGAQLSARFRLSRTLSQRLNRLVGSLFIFLGIRLAMQSQ